MSSKKLSENQTIWVLSYFSGVLFSLSVVAVAVIMNWCATQILAMGYTIPLLVPGFFPFQMYWFGTSIAVFVVGPPLWMVTTYFMGYFHIFPHGGCDS
jgi:hypothetical protein